MVFKAVYHFADSNLGVEISWKKRDYRKRGGVSEVVLPRRGGNDSPWERKGLPGRPAVGETTD